MLAAASCWEGSGGGDCFGCEIREREETRNDCVEEDYVGMGRRVKVVVDPMKLYARSFFIHADGRVSPARLGGRDANEPPEAMHFFPSYKYNYLPSNYFWIFYPKEKQLDVLIL
jgi:hypothetical protein